MESSELLTADAPRALAQEASAGRRRLTWSGGLLSAFLLLTACTVGRAFDSFDLSLDTRFHDLALSHAGLVDAMSTLANVGGPSIAVAVGLTIGMVFFVRGDRRPAAFCAVSSVGAFVLAAVVKLLVDRHRPVWVDPVAHESGPSYPSGHATGSAALAALLIIVAVPLLGAGFLRWTAVLLLLLYAVLIAISRLVLGVHYPTDVIGGALLGAGWTLLCAAVLLRPRPGNQGLELPTSSSTV